MAELAHVALLLALILALYSVVISAIGARGHFPALGASARNGIFAVFILFTLAMEIMVYGLVTDDFEIDLIAQNSSSTLPLSYKIAALYSSKTGSLMFWGWLISFFTAIFAVSRRSKADQMTPSALATLAAIQAFFLILITLVSDAFATSPAPADGNGLNPLLQNPGMLVHAPLLFLGFAGFAIVFAIAIGGLCSGTDEWVRTVRRWALVAWCALGLGNIVGAWWAYVELGWGGYWAWDPVENAGLMPWLLGTALLHSLAVQRKRGYLGNWSMALAIFTFVFTLLSPFITHGGIDSPLHGFQDSPFVPYIGGFILTVIAASVILLLIQRKHPHDSRPPFSPYSREGTFLLTNVVLAIITVVVLMGTIAPGITDMFGEQTAIERGFFDWGAGPILLLLVLLMGICPLMGWRRTSPKLLKRNFIFPFGASLAAAVALLAAGIGNWYAITAFVCGIPVSSTLQEWFRGTRALHRTRGLHYFAAFPSLIWGNRPRYGGMIVHLGIVLITIGVVGSTFYDIEREATLHAGESLDLKGYTFSYNEMAQLPDSEKIVTTARIEVHKGSNRVAELSPQKNLWFGPGQFFAEPAIRTRPTKDLYVSLVDYERADEFTWVAAETPWITLKAMVNPLVLWIWIGGGVLLLGGIIAFWPGARRRST